MLLEQSSPASSRFGKPLPRGGCSYGFRVNADAPGPLLRKEFRPSRTVMEPLRNAMERGLLSVRALDRCLRVTWTRKIADVLLCR
ncbi:hypothetical protein [Mycobacteroides chelonae]|uniref:Mg chelatase-related protein C-terminal domain-containing protein n=1 Tax=Mycobacteroides chelonae TaxID=1774 RepID=A0AB73U9Y2_MYCCH|nr:hypothetical protein FJK96_16130 [Mycobacteroides chelonae]